MSKSTKISSEYAAGLFDGEGSIGIYPKVYDKPYRRSDQYRVTVTGCWLPMLVALQETYGGTIGADNSGNGKQKWRWGVWSITEQDVFLRDILPFSIEKKEQIETFLAARAGELSPRHAGELLRTMKQRSFPVEGGGWVDG